FSALCLQISRHLHLNIFKTACHQAPEQGLAVAQAGVQ
ncbi:CHPT1 isoform 1, partial [Pan troglodytes]